jgi:hypothetical protein
MWHMWHTLSEVEAMEIYRSIYWHDLQIMFKVTWIISEKFHSKISEQFIMIMMSYTFPTTLDGNTDCSSFFFNKGISRMLLWIVLYYNLQTTLLYYNVYKRPCCTTMSTNDLVVLQSTNDLVVLQCMQCVQYNSHSLLYNTYTIEIY